MSQGVEITGKGDCHLHVSLNGFTARPNDVADRLFQWYYGGDADVPFPGTDPVFRVARASAVLFQETWPAFGAEVTGRRTFDLAHAWGGRPPMGLPHFVVTHRVPSEWVRPGSPFTFVMGGVESAVEQARQAAGEKNVSIGSPNIACSSACEPGCWTKSASTWYPFCSTRASADSITWVHSRLGWKKPC